MSRKDRLKENRRLKRLLKTLRAPPIFKPEDDEYFDRLLENFDKLTLNKPPETANKTHDPDIQIIFELIVID